MRAATEEQNAQARVCDEVPNGTVATEVLDLRPLSRRRIAVRVRHIAPAPFAPVDEPTDTPPVPLRGRR